MGDGGEEIVVCYACGAPMNVADLAPYSRVVCPGCGEENRVKKQFGPYTLIRRHAIGGMSSVFVAVDGTLNREVALKILSEEFSKNEKRIAAFEQEARLTASLSHPNVVRVFTTGKAFDRFYIAMEFVPGGHFEQRINEKGLISESELLPLAIQIAEGLKGAQSAGLIHRDVKPGNILFDSEGNAKIVDFGLALMTKGGKAKATEIWATPYYVPPETIEGEVEDFRSDMYAFGATLYHALSGKPPCDEESMATDILREAKKKLVPLKKVAPHLSNETCGVIDRAMAYESEKRFGSYDEMIAGLRTALRIAHGEVVSDQDGISNARRRAGSRKKNRLSAIVLVSLGIIAGIAALVVMNRSKKAEPDKLGAKSATVERETEEITDSPQEIATRYSGARAAMERGDYVMAGAAFASLLQDKDVQEPTRTWAGIEAVAVSLMDGRVNQARQHAEAVEQHIEAAPAGLSPGFLLSVQPVLKALDQWPYFKFESMAAGEGGSHRSMGYLLAGLKNWEHGGLEEAQIFFNHVIAEPLAAKDELLVWYQKVARRYVGDYQLLGSAPLHSAPKTVEECQGMKEELGKVLMLLKTKGRAPFNIEARLLALAKLEKSFEKPPENIPSAEAGDLVEIESLAKSYQFVEIIDRLSKLTRDPPNYTRESILGITEAALVFISEMKGQLQKKPMLLEMKTKDGTAVSSLMIKEGKELMAILSSGETRELQWTDFDADQLIELHREMVKNPASEMERLRRHESAIAFDWLAGNRQRAVTAASRLAAESAGFKGRWEMLASGLPR
ncbi:MAG: protein kinase [Armatimonadetes bacterium]|nr:protein kinase [Akkermansiaceae bacterium]